MRTAYDCKGVHLDKLDKVHKVFIKQIFLPAQNVADPAIYIIAGALPVEAIIHTRAMTLFGSISRLEESSI